MQQRKPGTNWPRFGVAKARTHLLVRTKSSLADAPDLGLAPAWVFLCRMPCLAARLRGTPVLKIAAVVLLLLWVLSLVTGRAMGGFVHVLLVLALVLGLISLARSKIGQDCTTASAHLPTFCNGNVRAPHS